MPFFVCVWCTTHCSLYAPSFAHTSSGCQALLSGALNITSLHHRSEAEIGVATHSAFLYALMNITLITGDESGAGLSAWFYTGEMRSVWLWFEDVDTDGQESKKTKL